MNLTPRPPPKVLLIHNGSGFERHLKHLIDAGLDVSDAHADTALLEAIAAQPDIVVLDFGCDGETTTQLKGHPITKRIPVIALVDLMSEE